MKTLTQRLQRQMVQGLIFFASFHRNSAVSTEVSGYETLVYANTNQAKICADYVNSEMEKLGFKNRRTKIRTELIVLNSTKMQAVLFEIGFISNSNDNALFDTRFEEICAVLASGILKAVGNSSVSGENGEQITPILPSGKKELGPVDCPYQVYTDRWWPQVRNKEDWGGQGDDYAVKYIAICVSKGLIKGRVHTRKSGWLPWLTFANAYNINDLVNGVLGDGTEILAIELYYYTPVGYMYKAVHYRVSVEGRGSFYAK